MCASDGIISWISLHKKSDGSSVEVKNDTSDDMSSLKGEGHVRLVRQTSVKLPADCFSSPILYRTHLFVGCRDNFLYSLLAS